MSLPKRRHSNTRQAKRRTHWKLKDPNLGKCTECGNLRLPHKICPYCGYYKGKKILTIKEKKKKQK